MQDNVEKILVLLLKVLGETQPLVTQNYLVPAAKKKCFFLNAALEFGEIGKGRKKLKTFAKDDETKNSESFRRRRSC